MLTEAAIATERGLQETDMGLRKFHQFLKNLGQNETEIENRDVVRFSNRDPNPRAHQ